MAKNEIRQVPNTDVYPTTSRYAESRYVDIGDGVVSQETWGGYDFSEIESDDTYAVIEKGEEYRPDIFSKRVYGLAGWWWVICETNDINDPTLDFVAGLTLRVPSRFRVLSIVRDAQVTS